jgi:hypothetical protein
LSGGDLLGSFRQMFGTEQLTADRAGEDLLAGIGAEERGEDGKGAARVERNGRLSRSGVAGRYGFLGSGIRYTGDELSHHM